MRSDGVSKESRVTEDPRTTSLVVIPDRELEFSGGTRTDRTYGSVRCSNRELPVYVDGCVRTLT